MLAKCVLSILKLNWNQRFRDKKTKLNICHHMVTSFAQLQNRSFHVVERTRTSAKCPKMKTARAKRAKLLFFIVKYANLWCSCYSRRRGCVSSLMFLCTRQYLRLVKWWYSGLFLISQIHWGALKPGNVDVIVMYCLFVDLSKTVKGWWQLIWPTALDPLLQILPV